MALGVTKRFLRSFGSLYASRGCDSPKISSGIYSAFGGISENTFCSIQSCERCSLLFACRRMSTSLLSPHFLPPKKARSVPKFSQGTYDDLVIPVTNFFKEDKGFMLLAGDVFDVPIRKDVVHRVVRWQLAKRRKGNASTKTRGEVRGGGRKPWRQKGSGRARHGSIRSPLWKGGGVAHGPKPRSHAFKLQRKYRRLGLKVALSARAAEGRLMVFEDFVIPSHKTKYLVSYVNDIPDHRGFLLVDGGPINPNLKLASQNLHHVNILPSIGLNVYSILKHPLLVMTREAVEMIVNRMHTPIHRPRSRPPKLS